jgi:hypothetical protein
MRNERPKSHQACITIAIGLRIMLLQSGPSLGTLPVLPTATLMFNVSNLLTPLITKRYHVYLKILFVMRSKHLPSRVQKEITE